MQQVRAASHGLGPRPGSEGGRSPPPAPVCWGHTHGSCRRRSLQPLPRRVSAREGAQAACARRPAQAQPPGGGAGTQDARAWSGRRRDPMGPESCPPPVLPDARPRPLRRRSVATAPPRRHQIQETDRSKRRSLTAVPKRAPTSTLSVTVTFESPSGCLNETLLEPAGHSSGGCSGPHHANVRVPRRSEARPGPASPHPGRGGGSVPPSPTTSL